MPIVAQGRKPHLPVQPRLMGFDELGTPFKVTRFIFKFIFKPGHLVIASLDNDLRPGSGHHGEETIAVKGSKWSQPIVNRSYSGRPGNGPMEHPPELD